MLIGQYSFPEIDFFSAGEKKAPAPLPGACRQGLAPGVSVLGLLGWLG